MASKLSEVELLSPLPSPLLSSGCWSLEPVLRNDVRRDITCWRVPNVSTLFLSSAVEQSLWGAIRYFLEMEPSISSAISVASGASVRIGNGQLCSPRFFYTQRNTDKQLLTLQLAANCLCAQLLAVHAPGIGHTFPLTIIYQLNVT